MYIKTPIIIWDKNFIILLLEITIPAIKTMTPISIEIMNIGVISFISNLKLYCNNLHVSAGYYLFLKIFLTVLYIT